MVGAGIVGLSTAYALTERGASVTVYERGVPGDGQSGGESRIFRHAHDDRRLVAYACEARGVWRDREERFGRELLSRDGVVAIGPAVERRLAVLREVGGVRARPIGGPELAQRLPLLSAWRGPAMIDEDGGGLRTRATVEALTGALRDMLVVDEVLSVRVTARGTVELRAGGVTVEHGRVVVCAGRGTAALARGAGLPLPVRQGAHVRLSHRVRAAPPARLACLQDGSGAFGEPSAYADPLPGNRAYAVGLGETPVHEDGSLIDVGGLAAAAERTTAYVGRALPGLEPDRSTPAIAGSPSCPGARTASRRGRPMGCSSSPATTSSSTRRRSAAPLPAPRSATASRRTCARKPNSAPRSSRRAANDRRSERLVRSDSPPHRRQVLRPVSARQGDNQFLAGPGTGVCGPRGVSHALKVESESARVLVVVTPVGFEQMFEEGDVAAASPSRPSHPSRRTTLRRR